MSKLTGLDRIFSEAIDRGDMPGVIAVVGSTQGTLYQGAFGRRDIGKPDPMTADTVVWIASMTKAITTVAIMQLVEQGRIDLDQPASRYVAAIGEARVLEGFDEAGVPKLRAPKRPVTVRQLLTHTAGYGYDFASSAIRQYLKATGTPSTTSGKKASLAIPLLFDPGETFAYGISTDWAGQIVEAISGQDLQAYFAEHILGPLGMNDTMFVLGADQHARRATVHAIKEDASLVATEMVVHQQPEFFGGGGGLYSTAGDYLAFLTMLLNGGIGNGQRILKADTVAAMAVDQIPPPLHAVDETRLADRHARRQFLAGHEPGLGPGLPDQPRRFARGPARRFAGLGRFRQYALLDRSQERHCQHSAGPGRAVLRSEDHRLVQGLRDRGLSQPLTGRPIAARRAGLRTCRPPSWDRCRP
ncbi:MAG: serine hydrolase domain-containing protein [Phreatobacter sp.]